MNISHFPENTTVNSREVILMAAYGAPYEVAADFNMYTLTLARNVPVDWEPVSALKFYNDFGYMQKEEDDFEDSAMNVIGVLITAGNIYTYISFSSIGSR